MNKKIGDKQLYMRKKIRVGKATDGLVGGRLKKPRYYAEIDNIGGNVAVSKIMSHYEDNPKHVERMEKGLRTKIRNFGDKSVLDRSLYVEKVDKSPIKESELDFINKPFEFDENQSRKLRRFVFSSKVNRDRYFNYINKYKKRK